MYRLASESIISREIDSEASPSEQDGISVPSTPRTITSEEERRRLLRKLQTCSISKLGLLATPGAEEEDHASLHSTKSSGPLWWQRTRDKFRKGSTGPQKQLQKFGQWRRKGQKTHTHHSYDGVAEPELAAFFGTPAPTKKTQSGGKKQVSRDDADNKSVASQRSLQSLFRRPVVSQTKQRRRFSSTESFADFSVEVQSATTKARPTLTRQGSSFVRRLLRSKPQLKVSDSRAWADASSYQLPDRLTPTTTDGTTSDDNDEDDENGGNKAMKYESEEEDEEEWEEEPMLNEVESDEEDEEIILFFRPIEPHDADERNPIPDRWSPSPSPSLEHESAPKLPMRRPLPDNDDLPLKLPIARKDHSIVYPSPAPIRAKPKKTWSGDSGILSIISGLVKSFSECNSSSKNEAKPKGILKRNSGRRSKPPRSVSFDSIFVREYERVLGDNPACSSGPPISIGWAYTTMPGTTLDEYETSKPRARRKRQLILSSATRKEMLLHEWNVSPHQLRQARRDAMYIQHLRSKTSAGLRSRKPSADHSDTSQPCGRRESTLSSQQVAVRYCPTPEIMMTLDLAAAEGEEEVRYGESRTMTYI